MGPPTSLSWLYSPPEGCHGATGAMGAMGQPFTDAPGMMMILLVSSNEPGPPFWGNTVARGFAGREYHPRYSPRSPPGWHPPTLGARLRATLGGPRSRPVYTECSSHLYRFYRFCGLSWENTLFHVVIRHAC